MPGSLTAAEVLDPQFLVDFDVGDVQVHMTVGYARGVGRRELRDDVRRNKQHEAHGNGQQHLHDELPLAHLIIKSFLQALGLALGLGFRLWL